MSKKTNVSIVIFAVIISLIIQIFLGPWLSAKLSTLPLLRRFDVLRPDAPIVITKKEVVHTSDSGDVLDAIAKFKNRISTVAIIFPDGKFQSMGTAINLTSDGWFLADSGSVAVQDLQFSVVLSDGRTGSVTKIVNDRVTSLVFLKAELSDVPVVNFGASKDMAAGEKALFVSSSSQLHAVRFQQSFVTVGQGDLGDQIRNADFPRRTFGTQELKSIELGSGIFNTNGELIGMFDNTLVLSSDVIRATVDKFLSSNQTLVRPHFGFSYQVIGEAKSKATKLPMGALVSSLEDTTKTNPAVLAGLKPGDIIIKVGNSVIEPSVDPEQILEKAVVGQPLTLQIYRAGQEISLTLTPTALQ
jgi:serine protease Do